MKLTLPYPPTINHYYAKCKNGKLRIGERGKQYRLAVLLHKKQLRLKQILGPIQVTIHMIPPDYRRRDSDNLLKCLLDSLNKAKLIEDDSMIVDLQILKHKPDAQDDSGKVIVHIAPVYPADVEVRDAGAWIV